MVLCWAFPKIANLSLGHITISSISILLLSWFFFLRNITSSDNPLAEKTERGLYLKKRQKRECRRCRGDSSVRLVMYMIGRSQTYISFKIISKIDDGKKKIYNLASS